MKTIDLAYKSPTNGGEAPIAPSYPTIHYSGSEPLDLPESGTMTIQFREVERSESKRNGKPEYSCTIEVQKITGVKGSSAKPPAKTDRSASDALDRLMKEHMTKEKSESDENY